MSAILRQLFCLMLISLWMWTYRNWPLSRNRSAINWDPELNTEHKPKVKPSDVCGPYTTHCGRTGVRSALYWSCDVFLVDLRPRWLRQCDKQMDGGLICRMFCFRFAFFALQDCSSVLQFSSFLTSAFRKGFERKVHLLNRRASKHSLKVWMVACPGHSLDLALMASMIWQIAGGNTYGWCGRWRPWLAWICFKFLAWDHWRILKHSQSDIKQRWIMELWLVIYWPVKPFAYSKP